MSYKYYTLTRNSSKCHIFEFSPNDLRLDVTIGTRGKLERLSKIKGEPKSGETAYAKINGGFFAMNGATEYIGTFVDEGLYYQGSATGYPTLIYWKDGNKLDYELNPTQSRCAVYQKDAYFAIGVPWMLVIDGKKNYIYTKSQLVAWYGHPWVRNPRTLIGQKNDGTIVWVVVDGRSSSSKGFTIIHSQDLMVELGCRIAANLDGGGSSEMIVNGSIKNKPSGGAERAIGTAFMAYKGGSSSSGSSTSSNYTVTAKSGTVTVTASSLNCRSGPGTSYTSYGTGKKGEKYNVTGISGSWYQVDFKGKKGFMSSQYLTYVAPASTSTPTTSTPSKDEDYTQGIVYNCTALNVRSVDNTTGKVLGLLKKGDVVKIVGTTSNNWHKIIYGSGYGYVSGAYIDVSDAVTTGVTTAALNMRKGASTSFARILCIPKGTTIKLTASQNGWYQTTYSGKTGWCSGDYIKLT